MQICLLNYHALLPAEQGRDLRLATLNSIGIL